jgi:hypothetical protein
LERQSDQAFEAAARIYDGTVAKYIWDIEKLESLLDSRGLGL